MNMGREETKQLRQSRLYFEFAIHAAVLHSTSHLNGVGVLFLLKLISHCHHGIKNRTETSKWTAGAELWVNPIYFWRKCPKTMCGP